MTASEWKRCSPIAAIYFFLRNLKNSINLWPALAGVFAVDAGRAFLFSYGIPLIAILILASALLSYWFFRFRYDEDKIQLHHGIFSRTRLTLNYARIQETNLIQDFYFRPFGLWTLELESAGSKQQEITIPGLNETLANELKQRVLATRSSHTEESEAQAKPGEETQAREDENVFLRLPPAELARFGLMHNALIYVLAIAAPILTQNERVLRTIFNYFDRIGVSHWLRSVVDEHSLLASIVIFSSILFFALVLVYLVNILVAVLRYWNYTLFHEGDRFQYNAGLINRITRGFHKHKLQTLVIRQSLIAKILRRYSVEIRLANEGPQQQGANKGFLIPVLQQGQLDTLLKILGYAPADWQRAHAVKILWTSLIFATALVLLPLLISAAATSITAGQRLAFLCIGLTLVIMFCTLYWYRNRFSCSRAGFAVRRGLLGHTITWIPVEKIQKIAFSQNPIGRLHQLAEMELWSGARVEGIGYVPRSQIQSCRDQLLEDLGRHRGPWM